MAKLIGRNTRVEVQKTLGSPITITDITKANPGVVTYTGTDPTEGDVIVLATTIEGMLEVAGQVARVNNLAGTANTFDLESLNTTNFTEFDTTGTPEFKVVSDWATLGYARSLNAGSASPNKIDATVLLDPIKQYLLAQSDTPEITVDSISNPLAEAYQIVEQAAYDATMLAFRVTLSDGSKRIFGGFVSLPSENIPLGDLITSSFSIIQVGRRMAFAS
jgi:hypothetical protein